MACTCVFPVAPRQHTEGERRVTSRSLGYAPVALGAHGLALGSGGAREEPAGERGPGDGADAEAREGGEHLALLFAVGEVVVVLHRDEGREVVLERVRCGCAYGWLAGRDEGTVGELNT